jgi:putative hydrolase of HD superfamily
MTKGNGNSLFRAAGKLKTTRRSGWSKKAGIENSESVADHSYRTALIGAYLGEVLGLNSGKMAVMCLIHDLAESKIGDLTPEEKTSEKEHRKIEDKVMKEILSTLPKRARKRFAKLWNELVENKSKEAKLVWQIDKLEMGLQMKDYAATGIDKSLLAEFDPSRYLSEELRDVFQNYS